MPLTLNAPTNNASFVSVTEIQGPEYPGALYRLTRPEDNGQNQADDGDVDQKVEAGLSALNDGVAWQVE